MKIEMALLFRVDFAVEYFKCLQQGLILDYPYRGQNIPYDFQTFNSRNS